MKKTQFYPTIWQMIPYSFEVMDKRDTEGKKIKDLVLQNRYALENGISEMTLNISRFSAFDKNGQEHLITDFSNHGPMTLKGMHTGLFLKSKSVLELKPGEYKSFRFYLKNKGNQFSYSDHSSDPVYQLDHLDFDIANDLTIKGNEANQVILRFDFVPFTLSGYFKSVQKLFRKSRWVTVKLANSFGH